MTRCIACLTVVGLQCILAEASTAEGWGAARAHFEAPAPSHGPPHALEEVEHAADHDEVTLTAGGSMHRLSPMVRRQHSHPEDSEGGKGQTIHHHVHSGSVKAMFAEIDTDGDGELSNHEVKLWMNEVSGHKRVPKALHDAIVNKDDKHTGGMTYTAFKAAAHDFLMLARPWKVEEKKHSPQVALLLTAAMLLSKNSPDQNDHLGNIHKHQHQNIHDALLQGDPEGHAEGGSEPAAPKASETADPKASWVQCGGHKAPNCDACTKTDASGATVFDHGSEWCNGDCAYQGVCKVKSAVTVAASDPSGYSTSPIPDLLKPGITATDEAAINAGASKAIKQENTDDAEEVNEEVKAAEDAKSWLPILTWASVAATVLAVVSCIGVFIFGMCGTIPTPAGKNDDEAATEEGAEGAEGGEAAEGEAAEAPAEEPAAAAES